MRTRNALLSVLFTCATAGCSMWGPIEPALDGWPLGEPRACSDEVLDIALGEARAVGPTSDVACYSEGPYLRDGQPYIVTRSGGVTIVVVTANDGSRHAIGVGCGIGCFPVSPPGPP